LTAWNALQPYGTGLAGAVSAVLVVVYAAVYFYFVRLDPGGPKGDVSLPDPHDGLVGRRSDIDIVVKCCKENALVFLPGESGVGKSVLFSAKNGVMDRLRDDSQGTVFPVYIRNINGPDWEAGPFEALSAALSAALATAKLAPELPPVSDWRLADLPALLQRIHTKSGRRLCVVFDQFDDYVREHRGQFTKDGSLLRPEELLTQNLFWRGMAAAALAQNRSVTMVFVSSTASESSLTSVAFNPNVSRTRFLTRLDRAPVVAAMRELALQPDDPAWFSLVDALVRDLEASGPSGVGVLPVQANIALGGLATRGIKSVSAYAKAGGLNGLQAAYLDAVLTKVAQTVGMSFQQVRLIIQALIDQPNHSTVAHQTIAETTGMEPRGVEGALTALSESRVVARTEEGGWQLQHEYFGHAFRSSDRLRNDVADRFRGHAERWSRALRPRERVLALLPPLLWLKCAHAWRVGKLDRSTIASGGHLFALSAIRLVVNVSVIASVAVWIQWTQAADAATANRIVNTFDSIQQLHVAESGALDDFAAESPRVQNRVLRLLAEERAQGRLSAHLGWFASTLRLAERGDPDRFYALAEELCGPEVLRSSKLNACAMLAAHAGYFPSDEVLDRLLVERDVDDTSRRRIAEHLPYDMRKRAISRLSVAMMDPEKDAHSSIYCTLLQPLLEIQRVEEINKIVRAIVREKPSGDSPRLSLAIALSQCDRQALAVGRIESIRPLLLSVIGSGTFDSSIRMAVDGLLSLPPDAGASEAMQRALEVAVRSVSSSAATGRLSRELVSFVISLRGAMRGETADELTGLIALGLRRARDADDLGSWSDLVGALRWIGPSRLDQVVDALVSRLSDSDAAVVLTAAAALDNTVDRVASNKRCPSVRRVVDAALDRYPQLSDRLKSMVTQYGSSCFTGPETFKIWMRSLEFERERPVPIRGRGGSVGELPRIADPLSPEDFVEAERLLQPLLKNPRVALLILWSLPPDFQRRWAERVVSGVLEQDRPRPGDENPPWASLVLPWAVLLDRPLQDQVVRWAAVRASESSWNISTLESLPPDLQLLSWTLLFDRWEARSGSDPEAATGALELNLSQIGEKLAPEDAWVAAKRVLATKRPFEGGRCAMLVSLARSQTWPTVAAAVTESAGCAHVVQSLSGRLAKLGVLLPGGGGR